MEYPSEECYDALKLPQGTVARIAKEACANPSARFKRDTLVAINRATALFITYLADAAREHAAQKKR